MADSSCALLGRVMADIVASSDQSQIAVSSSGKTVAVITNLPLGVLVLKLKHQRTRISYNFIAYSAIV
jgi:hypothetical protein